MIKVNCIRDNPPKWFCKNKKLVYELATPKKSDSFHGKLEYTRWEEFPLPSSFKSEEESELEIEVSNDVFDYSPPEDDNTVVWYVNFADSDVFGYYGTNLFAQDESQCLEHPALCSLRVCLAKNKDQQARFTTAYPNLTKNSSSDISTVATPILVRGVERKVKIMTNSDARNERPYGLYGRHFSQASPNAIKLATTIFDERIDQRTGRPYYSNIIAIEAPKYGRGSYTIENIKKILVAAYSGFLAAKFESLVENGILERIHEEDQGGHTNIKLKDDESTQKPRVIIHTGNWGCGAYGGNVSIMSCLQIAAAHLAGIDKIIYHTVGKEEGFDIGLQIYKELIDDVKDVNVVDFIENVEMEKLQWGFSNGT
ncbi:11854_t:CDS:2 [Funneliformis mosseae]|uniref:11854_t:CDS:1 n=1 Tax=Funneliformis mosseae TaxID=27381 RepID=A0A9N9DY58_FUNMO|nr:11854_t:CDS:2 [Funneliformis mosseae]